MQSDAEICIWKSSYLENGSSFDKLLPSSDLNRCVSCSDYTHGSPCLFYVPKIQDRGRFSQAVKAKLQRIGGLAHENV